MIERQKSFLVEILGEMGSNALFKSLDKSELITQALLPRAIFSWVKGVGEFDGIIPGGEELISFTKSEKGFSGKIGEHKFKDESLIHVAAVLAATMGTEKGFNAGTKSSDLEKLGKSVDLLVRSKLVQEGLAKNDDMKQASSYTLKTPADHTAHAEKKSLEAVRLKTHPAHIAAGEAHEAAGDAHQKAGNARISQKHYERADRHRLTADKHLFNKNDDLEKAGMEPPVKNAAPVAPTAPVAAGQTPAVKPAAPAAVATAPKMPKIKTATPKPAGATVALTRSEMNFKCPACADSQFKDDEFVGCICFQVLNKSIDMLALDELGCVIHVSEDFDTIKTLMESMGRY